MGSHCPLEWSEYAYAPVHTGGPGIYTSVQCQLWAAWEKCTGSTHGIFLIALVNVEHNAGGVGSVFPREGNKVSATFSVQYLIYALGELLVR